MPHSFADLPPTPAAHFNLYFYAAVLHICRQAGAAFGSLNAALERVPFLSGYCAELAAYGIHDLSFDEIAAWHAMLDTWEAGVAGHLPLRALREVTGLDHAALTLLLSIGSVEEDARFGLLFEELHGIPGQHRPTAGLLNAWCQQTTGGHTIRANIRRLIDLGLVAVINPDAPRTQWALHVPGPLWDALHGDAHGGLTAWIQHRAFQDLVVVEDLIVPESIRQQLEVIPTLLDSGEVQALIARGPQQNGRRTMLGAVAHALGRGVLQVRGLSAPEDERWGIVGPLATMLHGMPVIVLDLAPGETADLPSLNAYTGPVGVVLGRQGGVRGAHVERALTITLEMPDVIARRHHWQRSVGAYPVDDLHTISERFRMTGGNIRRAADLARSYMLVAGRHAITLADVQQATRALNRQVLDTLATHIPTTGDWGDLAISAQTQHELFNLERRCRHRERLQTAVGEALDGQLNTGVRAIFSGPSGTGKTLAARLLASMLQIDLYRLDISSVVNKYIGETEKNLSQIFARAEELDVILLIDEGDALLTQRTNVQTSNDRYANLETSYLLQRLEAFEGILIVTTNANDRIDSAFQRRMDVVVEFHPPEAAERWAIWQLHLPATHSVDVPLLSEVASRCTLTGGQIRNAALHAALLALDDGGIITASHLETAVQREYRKMGAICPLRRTR